MESQDQTSESKVDRGKFDPGWNDPPTFSYNSQSAAIKPKLALNKRVAFPLSSNAGTNPPVVPQLPPSIPLQMPAVNFISQAPCVMNPVNPSSANLNTLDNLNLESVNVNEVVGILNEILEDNKELGNKLEDIRKRINVMKTMWEEGKLPNSVQILTTRLVKALKNSDTKTADEIHKSLMVDHVSCVRSWMVAIKQLILHCEVKNDLLNIEESDKGEVQ